MEMAQSFSGVDLKMKIYNTYFYKQKLWFKDFFTLPEFMVSGKEETMKRKISTSFLF